MSVATDPARRDEFAISFTDADDGTEVVASRRAPARYAASDETGWRESLAKLAALVEAG